MKQLIEVAFDSYFKIIFERRISIFEKKVPLTVT